MKLKQIEFLATMLYANQQARKRLDADHDKWTARLKPLLPEGAKVVAGNYQVCKQPIPERTVPQYVVAAHERVTVDLA